MAIRVGVTVAKSAEATRPAKMTAPCTVARRSVGNCFCAHTFIIVSSANAPATPVARPVMTK